MPAEAVIVDDGGSTEIRWVKDGKDGNLDGLLKVGDMGHPRKGSKHVIKSAFTQVRVAYHDQTATALDVTYPVSKYVEIASGLGQNVRLENLPNRRFKITAYSDVMGPVVECTLSLSKRVYIVRNSTKIETVTVDGTVIYNVAAGARRRVPANIKKTILVTSITVS